MSSAASGAGSPAGGVGWVPGGGTAGAATPGLMGVRPARACRQAVTPLAGEHAEAERERLGARVQRGMTQLLVAGVQPAAGSTVLAGIQAGAWFSSRVAR